MLYAKQWRALNAWAAQLRWWQRLLCVPLYTPAFLAAGVCLFPKTCSVGAAAVLMSYGYLIYLGVYSPIHLLAQAGVLFGLYTAWVYVIAASELVAEPLRRRLERFGANDSEHDSDSINQ